jgi:hypothetical protein
MTKRTRQVQRKRLAKELLELKREEELALERGKAELIAQLEAEGWPIFLRPEVSGRRYPGEAEAFHVLGQFIRWERPPRGKKIKELLKAFRILRDYEEIGRTGSTRAVVKGARVRSAWDKLERAILSDRVFAVGPTEKGLVVEPVTEIGRTAFGLLSLAAQQRLARLRQCLHCRWWFYARFKHQRFCNDPAGKCQWNHYHTPEWRRQHREQNRKHQREYRKRLFGKNKD